VVRQAERRRQTRTAILAAAKELFGRDGYEATSVDAVVAHADVAKGTFYQHFDGKIAVVLALAHQELAEVAPRVLAGLRAGHDPLALLTTHLREQCAWFERHRALAVPLIEYGLRFAGKAPPANPGASSRGMFEAYLAQAQARGQVRADYPARELAAILSGMSSQAIYSWASRRSTSRLWPSMERLWRVFLEGAAPSSAAKPAIATRAGRRAHERPATRHTKRSR
jgi:AcrR family transcriptional regulator